MRKTLTYRELKKQPIILPSLQTQHRIADYLDAKCAQIDRAIARQQEVIEKLKEYKLSVITEAITKGVNPDVPIKDSGIEWIGEIPKHWKVGQLKYFSAIRSGITLGKEYQAGTHLVERPYLRVANVQGEYTDLSDVATIMVTPDEATKYALRSGELLMTEGGDRDKLGRGCVWKGEIEGCLHQNHVFALSTTKQLDVYYLDYLTSSHVARNYFDYTAKKTTNLASTNSSTILQFQIPIPSVLEQEKIVTYLDNKCRAINEGLAMKRRIIENLAAYKKSLIYEVVTGKREV